MKVRNRQQFGLPLMKPSGARKRAAFWTMPIAAGIITVTLLLAVVALFDMATEGGGTADLNGAHQAKLMPRQRMHLPVSRPVFSKNIGQFEYRP